LEDALVSDSSPRSRSDAAATQRWVERLDRFAAGNQTVVAFCAAEGVSESNFYLWRRRLAPPPASTPSEPTVVPIRLTSPPAPTTPIELALPSGTVLRFPADARPELIVAILRGLEGRPC
jgi:transposase